MTFTWSAGDRPQSEDSWEWKRTDTGAGERTDDTSVTLTARGRTCVQVRLIRGSFASPWAERCVE